MTLEDLYKKETGRSAPHYSCATDCSAYDRDFYEWVEKKFSENGNLLALAVARFRAGEAYIKSIEYTHGNTPLQESRRDYLIIAIAAYDAAVKGEGE